jgi:acetyltransferase-like isoleucine patch superfamily enzyme
MSLIIRIVAFLRKLYFRMLSDNYRQMTGIPILRQPLLIKGEGNVNIAEKVQIGYELSPGFWSTYVYFDLRGDGSLINLGDGVILNNNTSLTADGAGIYIGSNTVAGVNLSILTSDGHDLSPKMRHSGHFSRLSVRIGENVFIGDNVMILKGVFIGRNTVIGAGSIVTADIPENVVAAGNPCRVIRSLPQS